MKLWHSDKEFCCLKCADIGADQVQFMIATFVRGLEQPGAEAIADRIMEMVIEAGPGCRKVDPLTGRRVPA